MRLLRWIAACLTGEGDYLWRIEKLDLSASGNTPWEWQ